MKAENKSKISISKPFIWSAGAILTLTALAKIYSAFGDTDILTYRDPIVGLPFGRLMLGASVAEIAVAATCFFGTTKLASGLVAWMSTSFAVYRIGLWAVDWQRPCGCLGNVTDAIGMSHATADKITLGLLAYMLIGSYAILASLYLKGKPGAGTVQAVSATS